MKMAEHVSMETRFYGSRGFLDQGLRGAKRMTMQKANRMVLLLHDKLLKVRYVCFFSTCRS